MVSTTGVSMRKLKVRHQRLPRIGDLFELETGSGLTVTIVSHRSGRRDLAIGEAAGEEPLATAGLTRVEAAAVALLLTGVHIELTTVRD
jgi:K+/H+ antiporter YhaU regulatory subunit KhtT